MKSKLQLHTSFSTHHDLCLRSRKQFLLYKQRQALSVVCSTKSFSPYHYLTILTSRENIPESLAKILLDDERAAPEKINSIMLFPGGGYFLAAKNGMWGELFHTRLRMRHVTHLSTSSHRQCTSHHCFANPDV